MITDLNQYIFVSGRMEAERFYTNPPEGTGRVVVTVRNDMTERATTSLRMVPFCLARISLWNHYRAEVVVRLPQEACSPK